MLIAFARLDGSHYRGATCRGARAHVARKAAAAVRAAPGGRPTPAPRLARPIGAHSPRGAQHGDERKVQRAPLSSVPCASASTSMRCAFSGLAPGCRRNLRSRAVVASMDPMQRATLRATRHAMRMAGTTALQDLLAEVAGRRRLSGASDTAARMFRVSPAPARGARRCLRRGLWGVHGRRM